MENWAAAEMRGATIRDHRFRKSLVTILERLSEHPGVSFSAAAGQAKRQAFHRFSKPVINSENKKVVVSVDEVMAGHFQETISRIEHACSGNLVLVAQDTSHFNYNGLVKTEGLGYGNSTSDRCLFAHSAVALTVDGLPLGVIDLDIYPRDLSMLGKGEERRNYDIKEKESYRWITTAKAVDDRLPAGQPVLFIQDREADIFAFLEAERKPNSYFLVRAAHPRKVEVDLPGQEKPRKGKLFDVAVDAPLVAHMHVTIPRSPNRSHQEIDLSVQSTMLRIMPPSGRKGVSDEPVDLWVVRAREVSPPAGEKAIEWVLISSMPIRTAEQACQMVRYYSKRWMIERLHYTIKSGGCNAERLRMDDADSIKLALAMYYITGWKLLHLTYLARLTPDAPASIALAPDELEAIDLIEKAPVKTLAESVIAIAKLGGYEYYKNAPPPGVKRLWIGLRRLQDIALGLQLARKQQGKIDGRDMIHG